MYKIDSQPPVSVYWKGKKSLVARTKQNMNRREILFRVGASLMTAAAVGLCGAEKAEAEPQKSAAKPAGDVYGRCAKACADCAKVCAACFKHCQGMAKAGMKGHEKSARLSADCLEICQSAAKIVARKGPLSKAICEACLKACEACGAPMAACAKSCADCAKVCREMIAAV
jgi:hypothetical protein